jgi:glycolate oxidase iron-sulfur subunit
MDSPRGRIHLITQILDSGAGTEATSEHFDRCLGCMACETACPSGVQYSQLIEAARSWAEPMPGAQPAAPLPPRSLRDRAVRAAIFGTFPYPARLRAALGPLRAAQYTGLDRFLGRSALLRRYLPEAAAALGVAPRQEPGQRAGRRPVLPQRIRARGSRRAVVGMLTGCVQQVLFPGVNVATARVLASEGCDVIIPRGQGCCGALSLHGGRRDEAAAFARTTIAIFDQAGVDAVIVNAAGCGSAMKEYQQLLARDTAWAGRAAAFRATVRDFSEFLAELGPVAPRTELPLTIAYHDACHLGHAQRVTAQPRSLLRGIPGVTLTEVADSGTCCGSAGIYNLVQPAAAAELGARKAAGVRATGADLLVSGNPGCTLQIAQALGATGHPMPVAHIAEVLDASIMGKRPETLVQGR